MYGYSALSSIEAGTQVHVRPRKDPQRIGTGGAHSASPPGLRQGHRGGKTRATRALSRASVTMSPADLWRARLAVKTLRLDQREAIAAAAEGSIAAA